MVHRYLQSLVFCLLLPSFAQASTEGFLESHPLAVLPFAAMLLAIAVLPLFAERFWECHYRKLYVALGLSGPVLFYLAWLEWEGQPGLRRLAEALLDYAEFIVLLGSLYVVCGGIILRGYRPPSPLVNGALLLAGAVSASLIGTTGASMLFIRPVLRINAGRKFNRHIPVFFIFLVSNLGGLLTPLGDPPLFLGFLRGIPFFWTLSLWKQWLVAVGIVLAVFLVWERRALSREPHVDPEALPINEPFRLGGSLNFVFLAGILAAVLMQSDAVAGLVHLPRLHRPWGSAVMLVMAGLSLWLTPTALRHYNQFGWAAIIEVAILFLGIFVTMVPALALLEHAQGHTLGLDAAWKYFWISGTLSSFLDNAPTYLTFATVAAEGHPFAWLTGEQSLILQAISAGSVLMGANTYIGNGPNFMVKALADHAGYRTPSFFGYMLYSIGILLPTFVLITVLFYLP